MPPTGNNFKMLAGLGLDCAGPGRQVRVHQAAHHNRPAAGLPSLDQPAGWPRGRGSFDNGCQAMSRTLNASASCLVSYGFCRTVSLRHASGRSWRP